jgi:hypothetical protein
LSSFRSFHFEYNGLFEIIIGKTIIIMTLQLQKRETLELQQWARAIILNPM